MKIWVAWALCFGILLLPGVGQACAVCFSGTEANRAAFTLTTAFLTGLPLAMIGGVVWWLRQRAREIEQRADPAARPPSAFPSPS